MKNVKVINQFTKRPCNKCGQKGCFQCDKGTFVDKSYVIVAKDKKGSRVAFQSDFGGK
jgi:hypothetical protein